MLQTVKERSLRKIWGSAFEKKEAILKSGVEEDNEFNTKFQEEQQQVMEALLVDLIP